MTSTLGPKSKACGVSSYDISMPGTKAFVREAAKRLSWETTHKNLTIFEREGGLHILTQDRAHLSVELLAITIKAIHPAMLTKNCHRP